jgi:fumarate reductase subunit C
MLFVAVILLGTSAYNTLAVILDRYYLSYTGIPFIGLVALVHILAVIRRFPQRYPDLWRHARTMAHTDTWTWIFQLVTAFGIGVLVTIHVWMVLGDWPITADKSASRIASFWWLYLSLLILGEYHAGFGLYRQFVKWGWVSRHKIGPVLKTITLIIIGLGLAALWAFIRIGGAA